MSALAQRADFYTAPLKDYGRPATDLQQLAESKTSPRGHWVGTGAAVDGSEREDCLSHLDLFVPVA